jgi:hypothetical protein
VLATLRPREEQILRMRFGIALKTEYTLEEVGKQFAVTRERIRQNRGQGLAQVAPDHALEGARRTAVLRGRRTTLLRSGGYRFAVTRWRMT